MGQYWKVYNLDKKEMLNPHKLGNGLKLWEQFASHPGTGCALIALLANMPEARGGGDLQNDPVIGSWAGNRIALIGDYAEENDLEGFNAKQIYYSEEYRDISEEIAKVIEHELNGYFEGDGWRHFIENKS